MSKVDYRKVSINVYSVRSAAKFIFENNPYNVYGSVREAEQDIFNAIKRLLDEEDWSIGTAGWTVMKFQEGDGYYEVDVVVDPAVGSAYYTNLEDFFEQEGVRL